MTSEPAPLSGLADDPRLSPSAVEHTEPTSDDRVRRVAQCFKEHHDQIVRWLEVRCGSLAIAREIANEAFVTLLQLQHSVNDLTPYVYKIAGNALARKLKTEAVHRRIQARMFGDDDSTSESPEPHLTAMQQSELVKRVLMSLKPRAREAVRLHYWEDLSYGAIVTHFAERGVIISTRTVMRWIADALMQCRRALQGEAERDQ